jgi:hypothetical protein
MLPTMLGIQAAQLHNLTLPKKSISADTNGLRQILPNNDFFGKRTSSP